MRKIIASAFSVCLLICSLTICACVSNAPDLNDSSAAITTATVTTTAPTTTTVPVTTEPNVPVTTEPNVPVTTPNTTDAPHTDEQPSTCMKIFSEGLAAVGKMVTRSRELTAEELQTLITFIRDEKELRMILAASHEPFYRAEDISLYELLYASNIKTEFPDNPFMNNGSMMTTARIKEVVKKYLGIDVTQEMLDKLVADGAEHFPDSDAYGFVHTDLSDFYPDTEGAIFGYETEDGKLLVHLVQMGNLAHVQALLVPDGDTYRVEAAEWINNWDASYGQ